MATNGYFLFKGIPQGCSLLCQDFLWELASV